MCSEGPQIQGLRILPLSTEMSSAAQEDARGGLGRGEGSYQVSRLPACPCWGTWRKWGAQIMCLCKDGPWLYCSGDISP